jgi:hypothetical protein
MNQFRHRLSSAKVVAVRVAVVTVTTGIVAMGAVTAPAQADTGWNRQIAPTKPAQP